MSNTVERTGDRIPLPAAPTPTRVGQATAVEQSRALAEVFAAVELARRFPRNEATALAAVVDSCAQQAVAERAFFRFPRAGGTVSGESIHLARELARLWGNIDYGIKEMARDDTVGQSEMLAYAWDEQTNTRVSNTFIVPHMRDKKGGPERLTDLRDIYETNANMGARRVRECIFAVLPPYLVEAAKKKCNETLANGGGVPLPQRIADAIRAYAATGITVGQLEQKIGRANGEWSDYDVAQLRVIYTSIQRGEVSREDEFPPAVVTPEEIAGAARQSKPNGGNGSGRRRPGREEQPGEQPAGQAEHQQDGDADGWPSVQQPPNAPSGGEGTSA